MSGVLIASWISLAALLSPGLPSDPPRTTSSQPASRPTSGWQEFRPGVQISFATREVRVQAEVAQRSVALEFLACFPGKEHESIALFKPAATSIYQALGLVGFNPGHPPRWNEHDDRFAPPAGDLVDIAFEYARDGKTLRVPALDWVRDREFSRTVRPRPFVFCGSVPAADGRLAADASGSGVALVDFPDCLVGLEQSFSSENAGLWAEADEARIPPAGTPVWVIFSPPQFSQPVIELDRNGLTHLNGRLEIPAECLAAIRSWHQSGHPAPVVIRNDALLQGDGQRLARLLADAGIAPDWVAWQPRTAAMVK